MDPLAVYNVIFNGLDAEFKKNLQLWYNKDKGKSAIIELQNEFAELV